MDSNGGEVRRLSIVYFLSRLGHVEEPHLLRVLHLTRNGVYLRDVKRWLGEMRGKEMPEAFSWSYKRRYKNGYVWQDLVENDLVTPFFDNEYVLKGSEVIPPDFRSYSFDEKRVSAIEDKLKPNDGNKSETPLMASPEIIEESPSFSSGRSTITEEYDSAKLEKKNSDTIEEKTEEENQTLKNQSSFYSILLMKKKNNKNQNNTSSSSSQSSFRKSNASSSSSLLRNLIGCGAVVTNDAVLVSDKTTPDESVSTSKILCRRQDGNVRRSFRDMLG